MKLPRELEEKILSRPDVVIHGRQAEKPTRQPRPKEFVGAGVAIFVNKIMIHIPTETKSEANQRGWQGKAKRTKSARQIMYQTLWRHHGALTRFVEHFHGQGCLRVTFTRLGGRELDDDNLRSACKSVRDTVAALMLGDDRDPRFVWMYGQEPGGAVGVRVEIECL